MEISVTVWGDLACFTSPTTKVERLSQAVPTPSAARGILSSIYSKRTEFFWMVTKIEVLKPIRYISVRRNEVKSILGNNMEPISAEDERTQRQTVFLYDVRYALPRRLCRGRIIMVRWSSCMHRLNGELKVASAFASLRSA